MYCGDETGAFICDIGYSSCKFGYGGEDVPKLISPSHVGSDGSVGYSALSRFRPGLEIKPIFRSMKNEVDCIPPGPTVPSSINSGDGGSTGGSTGQDSGSYSRLTNGEEYLDCDGIIQNYDAIELSIEKAFTDLRVRDVSKWTSPSFDVAAAKLRTKSTKTTVTEGDSSLFSTNRCPHPVCIVESGHSCYGPDDGARRDIGRKQREKLTEILFEKFNAPAVFMAPSSILSAFSVGRQTGLVIDIGGGGCRATPVVDGLPLKSAQRRNGRGGEWLSDCQYRMIRNLLDQQQNVGGGGGPLDYIHPRYAVGKRCGSNVLRKYGHNAGSSATKNETERSNAAKRAKFGDDAARGGIVFDGKGKKKTVIYPSFSSITSSYHRNSIRQLMHEMKTSFHVSVPEKLCSSNSEGRKKGSTAELFSSNHDAGGQGYKEDGNNQDEDDDEYDKYYELPDGTKLELDKSPRLRTLPELLFSDLDESSRLYPTKDRPKTILGSSDITRTLSTLPLHKLAHDALSQTDIDIRKELCGNIILCGASSLYPNLEQRLSNEMSNLIPGSPYRCKVIAAKHSVERQFASWIGASILTSLGSFQQLWLSRIEYEEYGVTLGCQRFP